MNQRIVKILTICVLLSSSVVHADIIKCAWISNMNRIILSAVITWPGHELENTKMNEINSTPISLASTVLASENIESGKFKEHISFKYSIVGRTKQRQIIFPANFYKKMRFIAYDSNLSGSSFESLVCQIQYIE